MQPPRERSDLRNRFPPAVLLPPAEEPLSRLVHLRLRPPRLVMHMSPVVVPSRVAFRRRLWLDSRRWDWLLLAHWALLLLGTHTSTYDGPASELGRQASYLNDNSRAASFAKQGARWWASSG